MSVIKVDAASHSYDVFVDEFTLDQLGEVCRDVSGGDACCIVSDSNVAPLYLSRAKASLESAGYAVSSFVFEAGEQSKTLQTYAQTQQAFAHAGLTRSSLVVALGGGVVGDLAGFAAATYMRGIRCVQVPTSLLACVDSSVGGKTAVDLPEGKNLVGAFFQPDAVLIDTSLLATLPEHFLIDGCGEVLKYGVIFDKELFAQLEACAASDMRLPEVIARCVELKRDVVVADEKEAGARQLLNFGHTLGHAIEKLSNFTVTHGFAVACGMVLVAKASVARGCLSAADAMRIESTVRAWGLLAETEEPASAIYEAALADKKRHGSTMNVVVASEIGTSRIETLTLDDFRAFVHDACV